jgi:hypothetical protein
MWRNHVGRFIVALGLCAVSFTAAGTGGSMMYVYELPDGTRVLTDYALSNKHYRLVRTGHNPRGMGHLVASRSPQLFRSDPNAYDDLIERVASEHGVDFALVKAIMHAESAFNPFARSHKGALGLMQLMPQTAQQYGIEDIYDPIQNIQAGVQHLKYLSQMFRNKYYLIIAAYNAGENAVKRYRGIPPYRETQLYVRKVLRYKRIYSVKS